MDGLDWNTAGSENNPNQMENDTKSLGDLGSLMNMGNNAQSNTDPEKAKNSMKALGDMLNLVKMAKANDTEGTKSALANLTVDLAKAKGSNATKEETTLFQNLTTISMNNGTETNSMDFKNETEGVNNLFKDKSHHFGHKKHFSSLTDNWNNSTDIINNSTDFGNNSTDNLLPNFDDLSTGLTDRDLFGLKDLPPIDLNKTYSESTFLSVLASLTMISFFYYVPRMLYFRASNLSNDSKHTSFLPLLYLSLIACAGAGIHVANAYYNATHNVMASLLTGSFDLSDPDRFTPFVYKALTASINRIVSPIVGLLCLQQISTHSKYNLQIFQSSGVQMAYCLVYTIFVFAYSFYREHNFMESIDTFNYPDKIHIDFIDLVLPIITTLLFSFAKHAISRQSLYTTEKYGPNGPTTLDRVSKVVVFQAVMTFFAICAIFWTPSEEEEKELSQTVSTWHYFFITAQTPVVHFVLFRSLLRSRKSTRICFLVCCHSGERVSTADNGVELNQHPRTNEPSEKHEEEEEANKEENTMETLDHNKIIIMPEGNLEEKPHPNKV